MNKSNFFISIGPPKTGTTWLYGVLNKHPEIKLPQVKEIRYFWAKEFLGKNNLFTNLFGKHWHFQIKRSTSIPTIKGSFRKILRGRKIDRKNLFWHLNYFCATQNDKWYESLFPNDAVSGDITPKYCELSDDSIKQIKNLIPDCKIIISLRDPIDREWSRVKMNLLKKHNKSDIGQVDKESVIDNFQDQFQNSANDYSKLIKRWSKFFDEDHLMIYYYDELVEDPQLLYSKICDFLKIGHIKLENINQKFNKGIAQQIPSEYENVLIDLNYKYIKDLASNYPNKYSKQWLNKYKEDRTK